MPILKCFVCAATCAGALVLSPAFLQAEPAQKIAVSASDQMKYDVTDITAKVGQPVVITLSNDGSMPKIAMAHNLVILTLGTDWKAFDAEAAKAAATDYIPATMADKILAHTKLLGPGDTSTVAYTFKAPGVYDYICTFPAHAATGMHGQITVK